MKVPGFLKNKYILYILLVIGIINAIGYIAIQDYNSLALFVVMGVLSSYFSKNMSVNLLVAILVTSCVAVNNKVQEGFEEKEENDEKEEKEEKKKCESDEECPEGKCDEGLCVDKKSGFKNNVPPSSPALVNEDSDESEGDRIDYAATMEQAYNNLQNMLGEDGMKSITQETKKLVSQQKDLMGTLNQMAPILTSAKETLTGLNLDDMGSMGDILKSMGGGAPPKLGSKKK
jgi:hypothetical protein